MKKFASGGTTDSSTLSSESTHGKRERLHAVLREIRSDIVAFRGGIKLAEELGALGHEFVPVDSQGYRTGSLNEAL